MNLSLAFLAFLFTFVLPAQAAPQISQNTDGQSCIACHGKIVASYRATAMANASGPANEHVITGSFRHAASGVNYRIVQENGRVWLDYERPGDSKVKGRRELLYFIGQGGKGRTYLFQEDGFLFESPVNWYGDRQLWDMTPGYQQAKEIPMNLPALPSCLNCHASGFRPPAAGTQNRYPQPVFSTHGVTCERCHGETTAHASTSAGVLNPAKLPADRRDAICMQCHLEGDAAIERAGKHAYEFQPGDQLSNYVRYYLLADAQGTALRSASQFEALAQSKCKLKSGDGMWCGTCHDPHRNVPTEERAGFYRAKCLNCHGENFAQKHHVSQPDCTTCHMPAMQSKDVAHAAVTDHRILKRPGDTSQRVEFNGNNQALKLIPFPFSKEADQDERDKALAWQALANAGMPQAQAEAEKFLHAQEPLAADASTLEALAYATQRHGELDKAQRLYEQSLRLDPSLVEAQNNLGWIKARRGDLGTAVKLWESAFASQPFSSNIGLNLAHAFCSAGQVGPSRDFTTRVLRFNPDLTSARKFLEKLDSSPQACSR